MARTIGIATLIAGTLDILFAAVLSIVFGNGPAAMLRGVASGPFPGASGWGAAGSVLGLFVHFALMLIMVTVFVFAVRHRPDLAPKPVQWGVVYGLITYVVMNLIVVPLRFGNWPPTPRSVATQLFAHIVLVGIPIAWVVAKKLRSRAFV
ncbi:MAG TPA: hypothetical protein VFR36_09230 [Sphingomicrobium sp.]|nr:hypothetical protein [Sphingomicrobium sp.]